jgi:TRAP-type transport system periplasmic protein
MLSRRSFLRRSGLLAAGAVLAPRPARADARSFTFGYDQPKDTAYGFCAETFSAKLAELSRGALTVRQFPSAALGQEPEMAQKVRAGDIDFAPTPRRTPRRWSRSRVSSRCTTSSATRRTSRTR